MKQKTKRILMTVGVVLLIIATLGTFMAFFGRNDFVNFKDKVEDAFVKEEETKENVNFIKNSNFKINTTEIEIFDETNCSSENPNLVDGWSISPHESTNFTIYQVSDGLMVSNEDTTNKLSVRQRFTDIDCTEVFVAKDLTFTTSINGVVYSYTMNLEMGKQALLTTSDNLVRIAVSTHPSLNQLSVLYEISASSKVIINWAQLEEGTIFTGYVPPVVK